MSRYRPTVAITIADDDDARPRPGAPLITASMTGVNTTYRPVMNADVDGDVYCSPTVCVAYPPNSSTPAMSPTRTSRRRSSPRRRTMAIANGPRSNERDAEAADEVGERRDVVERVVDERERDAEEERGGDERAFGGEAPHRVVLELGRPSRASGW